MHTGSQRGRAATKRSETSDEPSAALAARGALAAGGGGEFPANARRTVESCVSLCLRTPPFERANVQRLPFECAMAPDPLSQGTVSSTRPLGRRQTGPELVRVMVGARHSFEIGQPFPQTLSRKRIKIGVEFIGVGGRSGRGSC